jgi:hypothetical protein
MRLLSVSVSGFKNVAQTTIELDGITALVSANNYGKSNVLDAISFGFDFISAGSRLRAQMMRAANVIPLCPTLAHDDYRFAMEFDDPDLGEYRFVRYGFAFTWLRDDDTGCKITDETIEIGARRGGPTTSYLKRAEGKYKKSHDTRAWRKIGLDSTQLAIDVLTAVEDIDINPAIRRIRDVKFDICDSLDTSSRFSLTPFDFYAEPDDESFVRFDDNDLSRALFRLKQAKPEAYDQFLDAVYTLFPEFEDVMVVSSELKPEEQAKLNSVISEDDADVPFRIKNELYRLIVKSSHLNQPVDISYMSTGTKRLVWLVANVIIAGAYDAGCIGVEEIETSIHPRMTKDLLEALSDNAGAAALLITSHSPFLVQYLKPERIYLGVPNDAGEAAFRRMSPAKVKDALAAARKRGLGLGEYLFELMSSDEEGMRALGNLLEA